MEQKMSRVITEVDIAKPVVAWLEDLGWTCYPEVTAYQSGPRADIVATKGQLVWVVEVKKSITAHLVDQIVAWRFRAHYLSVAVSPNPQSSIVGAKYIRKRGNARCLLNHLQNRGVGILRVNLKYEYPRITEERRARLFRKCYGVEKLRSMLNESYREWDAEPGNAENKYITPFRVTCANLKDFVAKNPGITLKTAMEHIDHHYTTVTSAKSSMAHWLREKKVAGLITKKDGRMITLFLTQENNNDNV